MARKTKVRHVLKLRRNERRSSQRLNLPLRLKCKWAPKGGVLQERSIYSKWNICTNYLG